MIVGAVIAFLIMGCSSNSDSHAEGNVVSVDQAIFGCGGNSGTGGGSGTGGSSTGGEPNNAGLQLQVLTNACGANQAQQFFRVVNNGTTSVKTSDIKITFWVNDTSGSNVVGAINTGGCLTDANGCYHNVSNVIVAVSPVAPACGTDANHQFNREITISSGDNTLLSPGRSWSNLQVALHLSSWGNFNPGTSTWYSSCLTGNNYVADSHFAVCHKAKCSLPLPIDDFNPCTTDSCDLATGVTHVPVASGTSCSDGNICNGNETCNDWGSCLAGTPIPVADGNPCTADSCDPETGNVAHEPLAAGTACPDGNLCNGNEICSASVTCLPGIPPVINDGDPCTTDYCVPASGVQHVQVAGNCTPCTVGGTPCPAPANPCVTSFCSQRLSQCLQVPADGRVCDDGNPATSGEICIHGSCVAPNTVANGGCTTDSAYAAQLVQEGEIPHDTVPADWDNMLKQAGGGSDKSAVISMTRADPVVIPVVVHVYEPNSHVSDEQIVDAIAGLNARYQGVDMSLIRPVFRPVAGTSHFRFELAKRAVVGTNKCGSFPSTGTPGINRVTLDPPPPKSVWAPCWAWTDGLAPWDQEKYLNIYVADMGIAGAGCGNGTAVQINPGHVNSTFPTLAHEVGHFLGLNHPVTGDCGGNDDSTCQSAGDSVCDTPAAVAQFPGCPYDTALYSDGNTCPDTLSDFPGFDPPDQIENHMVPNENGCSSTFSRGQIARMESRFLLTSTGKSKLPSSNTFSPPVTGSDLWIRDGEGDDGSQPNAVEYPWWTDDIWVRRSLDNIEIHENPMYGRDNTVNVRVRNRGCDSAASGTVHLYWAKAATNLGWPSPWDAVPVVGSDNNLYTIGGEIGAGVDTGSINAGDSHVVQFTWNPPNPADFTAIDADKSHFCLLACVGTCPTDSVSFLPDWVRKHNDVVQKNVTVIGDNDDLVAYLFIGGLTESGTDRLVFDAPAGRDSVFDWGQVYVDLGKFCRFGRLTDPMASMSKWTRPSR